MDIVVCRDNYKKFIPDLMNDGFVMAKISCWEWGRGSENNYGLEDQGLVLRRMVCEQPYAQIFYLAEVILMPVSIFSFRLFS
jgi:hypothetical protein